MFRGRRYKRKKRKRPVVKLDLERAYTKLLGISWCLFWQEYGLGRGGS